jgi:hypothetical protein
VVCKLQWKKWGGGRQYEKMALVKFKFRMLCNSSPLSFCLPDTRHRQIAQLYQMIKQWALLSNSQSSEKLYWKKIFFIHDSKVQLIKRNSVQDTADSRAISPKATTALVPQLQLWQVLYNGWYPYSARTFSIHKCLGALHFMCHLWNTLTSGWYKNDRIKLIPVYHCQVEYYKHWEIC